MYTKILLAVDGSGTSDHALREAARLADASTVIRVVAVADNPTLVFAAPYGIHYDLEAVRHAVLEQAKAALQQAQGQLHELAVNAESRLLDVGETDPGKTIAEAILAEASSWGAELIVLGTHGRRGVRRALLGSVAEQVVRTSPIPVLLVRSPAPSLLGALNPAAVYQDWPEDEHIERSSN